MRRLWTTIAVLAACGDGSGAPDGGGADADVPDARPDAADYPACMEFDAPTISFGELPLAWLGDLGEAGADVVAPDDCQLVDAPFGVSTIGADAVVAIDGLIAGMEYVVRLDADDDLAFYVATGCSTESGPAGGECLLFVDATVDVAEVGRFVAPEGGRVYVIVDYWAAGVPNITDFTLEVYQAECETSDSCAAPKPVCDDGRCVGCTSDFDCFDPATPLCDEPTFTCVPGAALCSGDDGAENGDDGPAGASVLMPGQLMQAAICNSPTSEHDFHRFRVTQPGEHWTITLAWTAAVDLDLEVYDARGQLMGISFYEQPERVALTYLPPGDYYAMIDSYATTQTSVATPYGISAVRQTGGACTSAADCAVEYQNQVFRGDCVDGACQRIQGLGLREPGERCDSGSDCTPDSSCPSLFSSLFFFIADADTRKVCGNYCADDGDCAGLGPDFVCTTYMSNNFCVQKCTTDDHCPIRPFVWADPPPWERYTCQLSTGKCYLP